MEKPRKNLIELIQLLRDRGLAVDPSEEIQLTRFLLDVNYYRASGYWRYFQAAPHLGDNTFKAVRAEVIENGKYWWTTLASVIGLLAFLVTLVGLYL